MYVMQTIQELLNRICWDTEFSRGSFEIGYFDRIEHRIVRLPLQQTTFDPDSHFFFQFISNDGITHSVPLHRIRVVYKNGVCIWQRNKPDEEHPIC
jgi:uncharacterized protein (UPF0248 family)